MNRPAYRIAKEGELGKKYVGCGTVRQQELRDTATEGQKLSAPIMHMSSRQNYYSQKRPHLSWVSPIGKQHLLGVSVLGFPYR